MLMKINNYHDFLVAGPDFDTCARKVERFFEKNVLVRYDRVHSDASQSLPASEKDFNTRLQAAIELHREVIKDLVDTLEEEGGADLSQWHTMEQGYVSNTVHTLAHLLDGFFGIDSRFYNLVDHSHQVSDVLMEKIPQSPQEFWLIKTEGSSDGPDTDRLPFLRKQG